jgi:solute carrier family 25 carnitine/acylcarnitine transporter 20/29
MTDAFIAGFAYGTTSVIVGQPLDTIKTKAQMTSRGSSWKIAVDMFQKEGLWGLYRGSLPMIAGGALIRSAQFGVNEASLAAIRSITGGKVKKKDRLWGVFDWQVIIAGFCGGLARGIVEGPFEFMKVRRQVGAKWDFRDIYKGSGATIARNSILFSSFVVYMDISTLIVDLPPFALGSICANMAWLTIWPMDVVKSQIQSGNNEGKTAVSLLRGVVKSGAMFRGLVPGLMRSTIANGTAMVIYRRTMDVLTEQRKAGLVAV